MNYLRKIEKEVQAEWEKAKIFEEDPPADKSKPKYFGTFPYPYMNGTLHLGHSFTLSKVEFTVQYQRMKGKVGFFPFGFHCTGMPIKASADKLKRELELAKQQPKEAVDVDQQEHQAKAETKNPAATIKEDPTAFHAKKTKVASKSSGAKTQFGIIQSMGVPAEEIPKFANAEHWLQYFPPIAIKDLKLFGAGIDWRRSFITTDVNPYYDAFVRWQFITLKDLGKVMFGKRFVCSTEKFPKSVSIYLLYLLLFC